MESWALFTAESGNELTRGWQATESQARERAQARANELGQAVELIAESELGAAGEDDEAPSGEVFEPVEGD